MDIDMDQELHDVIYEITQIATKKAISLGYSYEDFRDLQHIAVIRLMVDEDYIFEDYAQFRHEIEDSDDKQLSDEEWNKVLAKAGDRMKIGDEELTEKDIKFVEEVRASLRAKGVCPE